jgi:hypothetical protein
VEKDAEEWISILGGPAVVWGMYMDAMAAAGFDAATPLFVATGLLSYGAEIEFKVGPGPAACRCSKLTAWCRGCLPQRCPAAADALLRRLLRSELLRNRLPPMPPPPPGTPNAVSLPPSFNLPSARPASLPDRRSAADGGAPVLRGAVQGGVRAAV